MGRGPGHAAQGVIMPTSTLVGSVIEEFELGLEGTDTFPVLANNLPFSLKFFLPAVFCVHPQKMFF